MPEDRSDFRPDLKIFGIPKIDLGWVYLIKNGELLKIGKTKNPEKRLKGDARTWLPDMEIIAVKPFWGISFVERSLHTALADYWYDREWYKIEDAEAYEFFIEGFSEFYEKDPDMNSVDFMYWMNGSGMSEFCIAINQQKLTLLKFHRQESRVRKPKEQQK